MQKGTKDICKGETCNTQEREHTKKHCYFAVPGRGGE